MTLSHFLGLLVTPVSQGNLGGMNLRRAILKDAPPRKAGGWWDEGGGRHVPGGGGSKPALDIVSEVRLEGDGLELGVGGHGGGSEPRSSRRGRPGRGLPGKTGSHGVIASNDARTRCGS